MTILKLSGCCLTGALIWLCPIGGAGLPNEHAERFLI